MRSTSSFTFKVNPVHATMTPLPSIPLFNHIATHLAHRNCLDPEYAMTRSDPANRNKSLDSLLNESLLVDQTSSSASESTNNTNHNTPASMVNVVDYGAIRQRAWIRHPFVATVFTAFAEHRPLILKPIHFWLLITRSVSQHVNSNAEALKTKFLTDAAIEKSKSSGDGKITLQVRRDEFVYNANAKKFSDRANGNDWAPVVSDFSSQIKQFTHDDVLPSLCPKFSENTPTEETAMQVVAMDCLQQFFGYEMLTLCGFPKITLTGTVEDWEHLWISAQKLIAEKCLPDFAKTWLICLESILPRLVETVKICEAAKKENKEPEVDTVFWSSFCKFGGVEGSGGFAHLNGWICAFFPMEKTVLYPYSPDNAYAKEDWSRPNWYGDTADAYVPLPQTAVGIKIEKFGLGLSFAPVKWNYLGTDLNLKFCAGFVGTRIVKSLPEEKNDDNDAEEFCVDAVTPEIGWFMQHTD